MQTPTPDFSDKAYLFPRINREGKKFGIPTLIMVAGETVLGRLRSA